MFDSLISAFTFGGFSINVRLAEKNDAAAWTLRKSTDRAGREVLSSGIFDDTGNTSCLWSLYLVREAKSSGELKI